MKFRVDINGLRAIAVLAVVIFHFFPEILTGGFAGVDVFFVISGYLMTGIIFNSLNKGNFSLLNFYIARANRIIPALAVLCALLLILGWFFLTPPDYRMLGKHVLSSMTFLSNIVYWQEAGYFDVSAHSKWLLHTWSLSVEWQFYVIYPLILLLFTKFISLQRLKYVVLIALLVSFLGNLYLTKFVENAAFYLLPSRAWELLLGGVAFLFPIHFSEKSKRSLEVLGLLLIVISYIFISSQNSWPGYLVLIPVIGTYLVIISNSQKSILANNLLQNIGSWSYSIYLWHWPLAVISFIYMDGIIWSCIGIILSILLGYISHRYIESLKFKRKFSGTWGVLKSKPILILFVVAIPAGLINSEKGYEFRLNDKDKSVLNPEQSVSEYFNKRMIDVGLEECRLYSADGVAVNTGCDKLNDERRDVDLIILGDSHGGAIAPGVLLSLSNRKTNEGVILNLRASGCIPLTGIVHRAGTIFSGCNEYNEYLFKELAVKYSDVPILLLTRLNLYLYGFNEKGEVEEPFIWIDGIKEYGESFRQRFKERFKERMCELTENHPLYILKPVPEVEINVPNKMLANYMVGIVKDYYVSYKSYQDRNMYTEGMLTDVSSACNARILDPLPYLDNGEGYMASKDGKSLYRDSNHLNLLGAKIISPVFDQIW